MRPPTPGRALASAARPTPLTRPTTSVPAVRMAPVEPAEKKASALPSRTALQPRTMLESRFLRTASVGCSAMPMTSVVTSASARECLAQKGATLSSSPATSASRSWSASSARAIPSSTTSGGSSPPIASTTTRVMSSPPLWGRLLAPWLACVRAPGSARQRTL